MRTASNSPLTEYGDKTTHVSITVLFVLKVQKNASSQIPSVKIAFRGGPMQLRGLRGT